MIKKAITCIILLILLINYILPVRVIASDSTVAPFTKEDFDGINEKGTVNRTDKNGTDTTYTATPVQQDNKNSSFFGLIGSMLTFVFVPLPLLSQALLTLAIMPDKVTQIQLYTIEDMLFGRMELFDIDYTKRNSKSDREETGYVPSSINVTIKNNVNGWFYAVRQFAIAAQFAVLTAIALLMAISSIASEKAKYKRMLIQWLASFVILILLPYIMAAAFTVSNVCVSIIRNTAESIVVEPVNNSSIWQTKGLNFEKTLVFGRANTAGKGFNGLFSKIFSANGWDAFALLVVYFVLAFYQIKFFFMYIKRLLSVGFLVIISPLITITYSIDKARDNEAQAFKTWLKEFLVNVFIQPLHALMFLVFMYSVYGILERAPILAILFLAALSRGEQLVRTVFKIDRTTSIGHLGKRKKG